MSCCFKRKSSPSKSAAAAQPAAAAQTPTSPVLSRILSCQSGRWNDSSAPCPTFEQALREITAGRKTSHWMWYIWPSLTGIRTTSKPDLMIPDLQVARGRAQFARHRTQQTPKPHRLHVISQTTRDHPSSHARCCLSELIPPPQCAIEYLSHPKLGPRLVTISQAAHAHLRAGAHPLRRILSHSNPFRIIPLALKPLSHNPFRTQTPFA
jgi:uncharacterized protein (DUF1810 family)